MSKVPSPACPRSCATVVFCAALAAVFSLISAAIHSMTLLRINSVLTKPQRAFPSWRRLPSCTSKPTKAPLPGRRNGFPQAKPREKG